MSVISLDTATDNDDVGSSQVAIAPSKKQQTVLFDVDGQLFRTTVQTIRKYPDSLLHRLVLDHPEVVAAGKPLFVDRRPDYFPWILECFRDSYHARELPDLPKDALEKELEFYGLPKTLMPTAQELSPKLVYSRRFFNELLDQIRASKMESYIPIQVWVYDVLADQNPEQKPERKWFIGPTICSFCSHFSMYTEHLYFTKAIDNHEIHHCREMGHYVLFKRSVAPPMSFSLFDISASGALCMDALNQEAAKHGLKLEQRYHRVNDCELPYLYLYY